MSLLLPPRLPRKNQPQVSSFACRRIGKDPNLLDTRAAAIPANAPEAAEITKPSGRPPVLAKHLSDLAFRNSYKSRNVDVRDLVTRSSEKSRCRNPPTAVAHRADSISMKSNSQLLLFCFAPFLVVGAASSCYVTNNANVSLSDGRYLSPTSIVIHKRNLREDLQNSGPAEIQLPTSYTEEPQRERPLAVTTVPSAAANSNKTVCDPCITVVENQTIRNDGRVPLPPP
jgi:hypothetical protein